MKKLLIIRLKGLFVFLFPCLCAAQETCYTPLYNQAGNKQQSSARLIKDIQQLTLNMLPDSIVVTIPVVVHVLHNNIDSTVIGGNGNYNISADQVASQILVLNQDYRRLPNTNGYNNNPVGVDAHVEFCLAIVAPDGTPTTGITRHYVSASTFDPNTDDAYIKSFGYWPSDQYLNIWVCNLITGYIGYAQLPDSLNLGCIPAMSRPPATDGIVIATRAFGTLNNGLLSSTYNLGRTSTHEVGHWIGGLIHPWGDAYCGNDCCSDTPAEETANYGCSPVQAFCNDTTYQVMIQNYMDYTPDACMNTFTIDQNIRIRTSLASSPRRVRLLNSFAKCTSPIYGLASTLIQPASNAKFELHLSDINPSGDEIKIGNVPAQVQQINMVIYDPTGRQLVQQSYPVSASGTVVVPTSELGLSYGLYLVHISNLPVPLSAKLFIRQ